MDLMTATPKLTGDVQKDIKNLSNHVFQLEEHLRYQLRNLDVTNFNDLGLARYENGRMQFYAETVEVKTNEFRVEIEKIEENLSGEIGKTNQKISSVSDDSGKVTAASIVAAINEAGSEVKIAADHVTVDASSFVVDGVISGIEIGTSYTGALSGNIVIKNEEISFMDTDPTLPYYNRKEISKISAYYDEGDSASAGLLIGSQNRITVFSDEEILFSVYVKEERKRTQWSFLDGAIHSTGNMILSSEDFVRIKCPSGGYWSIEEDRFYKVDPYGNRVLYIPAYPT